MKGQPALAVVTRSPKARGVQMLSGSYLYRAEVTPVVDYWEFEPGLASRFSEEEAWQIIKGLPEQYRWKYGVATLSGITANTATTGEAL